MPRILLGRKIWATKNEAVDPAEISDVRRRKHTRKSGRTQQERNVEEAAARAIEERRWELKFAGRSGKKKKREE